MGRRRALFPALAVAFLVAACSGPSIEGSQDESSDSEGVPEGESPANTDADLPEPGSPVFDSINNPGAGYVIGGIHYTQQDLEYPVEEGLPPLRTSLIEWQNEGAPYPDVLPQQVEFYQSPDGELILFIPEPDFSSPVCATVDFYSDAPLTNATSTRYQEGLPVGSYIGEVPVNDPTACDVGTNPLVGNGRTDLVERGTKGIAITFPDYPMRDLPATDAEWIAQFTVPHVYDNGYAVQTGVLFDVGVRGYCGHVEAQACTDLGLNPIPELPAVDPTELAGS